MEQIRDAMNANDGCLRHQLVVPRMRGQLRLVIRCRNSSQTCWSMSVILYSSGFDGRIDCIDWEGLFVTIEGKQGSGFHRHIWDPKKMDCEKAKMALPLFQPVGIEQFILQGFALLGVKHEPDSPGGFIQ
jgi:hypothetical protein